MRADGTSPVAAVNDLPWPARLSSTQLPQYLSPFCDNPTPNVRPGTAWRQWSNLVIELALAMTLAVLPLAYRR
mgnify:CR=1 FL=1